MCPSYGYPGSVGHDISSHSTRSRASSATSTPIAGTESGHAPSVWPKEAECKAGRMRTSARNILNKLAVGLPRSMGYGNATIWPRPNASVAALAHRYTSDEPESTYASPAASN